MLFEVCPEPAGTWRPGVLETPHYPLGTRSQFTRSLTRYLVYTEPLHCLTPLK